MTLFLGLVLQMLSVYACICKCFWNNYSVMVFTVLLDGNFTPRPFDPSIIHKKSS